MTAKYKEQLIIVTDSSCECSFKSTMQLPCRHMLKLYAELNEDLYQPHTCALRWTRNFYIDSHPIFGDSINADSAILHSTTSIAKKKSVA